MQVSAKELVGSKYSAKETDYSSASFLEYEDTKGSVVYLYQIFTGRGNSSKAQSRIWSMTRSINLRELKPSGSANPVHSLISVLSYLLYVCVYPINFSPMTGKNLT